MKDVSEGGGMTFCHDRGGAMPAAAGATTSRVGVQTTTCGEQVETRSIIAVVVCANGANAAD